MKKNRNIIKLVLFTCTIIISLSLNLIDNKVKAYSPEEANKLQEFIKENNDLIGNDEEKYLERIIDKLNKYMVLSQEEREYIQNCELNVIREKLGDTQFEEYKKLIKKRSSGVEFSQIERFRLYELEKMLR